MGHWHALLWGRHFLIIIGYNQCQSPLHVFERSDTYWLVRGYTIGWYVVTLLARTWSHYWLQRNDTIGSNIMTILAHTWWHYWRNHYRCDFMRRACCTRSPLPLSNTKYHLVKVSRLTGNNYVCTHYYGRYCWYIIYRSEGFVGYQTICECECDNRYAILYLSSIYAHLYYVTWSAVK